MGLAILRISRIVNQTVSEPLGIIRGNKPNKTPASSSSSRPGGQFHFNLFDYGGRALWWSTGEQAAWEKRVGSQDPWDVVRGTLQKDNVREKTGAQATTAYPALVLFLWCDFWHPSHLGGLPPTAEAALCECQTSVIKGNTISTWFSCDAYLWSPETPWKHLVLRLPCCQETQAAWTDHK